MRACNNLPQPNPYIFFWGGCGRLLHALTPPRSAFLYLQFLAWCHPYILLHFYTCIIIIVHFLVELIHELEIIGSSERPVVGVKFTLVCTVYSDLLAAVTWFGHNQSVPLRQLSADISVTHEAPIESGLGVIYRATLVFHTLRASHGNVYTCKSQVNLTSTRQSVSQVHWLRVYSEYNFAPFLF